MIERRKRVEKNLNKRSLSLTHTKGRESGHTRVDMVFKLVIFGQVEKRNLLPASQLVVCGSSAAVICHFLCKRVVQSLTYTKFFVLSFDMLTISSSFRLKLS